MCFLFDFVIRVPTLTKITKNATIRNPELRHLKFYIFC